MHTDLITCTQCQPPSEVIARISGAQDVGGSLDVVVAGSVAESVVDVFQPVQVDHDDAGGIAEAAVPLFLDLQVTVPAAAVQQSGQRVDMGLLAGGLGLARRGDRGLVGFQHRRQQAGEDREQRLGQGWPNAVRDGDVVAPADLPGTFNSPHGIAVTRDGAILVTEWLIVGRIDVLTPVTGD